MSFHYKIATSEREFEQIHRLNYQTFVEEIPQHSINEEEQLIDRFHHDNTYIICIHKNEVIGMIAVRDKRPFSLDEKIPNLNTYLPKEASNICEIRLLTIVPKYRNGRVLVGLIKCLYRYIKHHYDMAVISGITKEVELYKQMGFVPFASVVGTEAASYQPMYLTAESFKQSAGGRLLTKDISFLPGPVEMEDAVQAALHTTPISHRSTTFMHKVQKVKQTLASMTHTTHVQIMQGSGTLANDAVAMQLTLLSGRGMILSNGEFGKRLQEHATRAGLQFDVIEAPFGEPYCYESIKQAVHEHSYSWLWFVHCETSTGILNDLETLTALCKEQSIHLCADCISTLGAIPLNLKDVYLATGVSGKAIGSYTGLAFVFYNHTILPNKTIPRYLDVGMYESYESVPYTHSSVLVEALTAALRKYETPDIFTCIQERYDIIRTELENMGVHILASKKHASPVIMTLVLDERYSSKEIGDYMTLQGYIVHYHNPYLLESNWIQIATIGELHQRDIKNMLKAFRVALSFADKPKEGTNSIYTVSL
ncbi:aminotransferase class V-fold PLP-dependent enzyme [Priestia taiwanensis]|uniref:Acetyltransferase n=1 Tax=Priestia taiwanensis TaxID=1347902 RepID=A0A917AVI5_9BACI|nr:aminotransferase class V-fold PLP-dependent enzyme [Priestia taiwanensis]MBM7363516.1 aspartate aminotransferase-like enzyme [Priestia taiwanensis]GGE76486.1 acetyltransferase [Priestia taiwanensis]